MKKLLKALCTALILAVLLGGAGVLAEGNVFAFLGGKYQTFADNFESDTPVAVCRTEHTEGGGCDSYLWDATSVRAVYDALGSMTVGAADNKTATDSDYIWRFIMADGSEVSFLFNQSYLEKDGVRYNVTGGEALGAVRFPCYADGFTMFDLYFDDAISAFAGGFESGAPVSVGFRTGSGELSSSDDPSFIKDVFYAMSSLEPVWVESAEYFDASGAQKSEFIFTMADSREFSFVFYGDCLAVDTGVAALGTQYYSFERTDALWSQRFAGYEDIQPQKGITYPLLPLYGEQVEDALSFANRESLVSCSVTRALAGAQPEEVALFLNSDHEAASDMADALEGMSYIEKLASPPDGEKYIFTFTLADGSEYVFEFEGGCAVIPDADGALWYYPVEHSDIEDGGLMDIVDRELELLEWKLEVGFGEDKKSGASQTVVIAAIVVAALCAAGALAFLLSRRAKRAAARNDTERGRE